MTERKLDCEFLCFRKCHDGIQQMIKYRPTDQRARKLSLRYFKQQIDDETECGRLTSRNEEELTPRPGNFTKRRLASQIDQIEKTIRKLKETCQNKKKHLEILRHKRQYNTY